MADKLDLLGVIGTWIAAVLALVALAGVIPVYILYRQSQTQRHIALNTVDDNLHEYVTRGYKLLPNKRFFRSTLVPDLTETPQLTEVRKGGDSFQDEALAGMRIEREFGTFFSDKRYSSTGWLNFANVLRAYNIQPPTKGELTFSGEEALLPVHRSWLLLIGLVDRYGSRTDKGLFIDDRGELEWRAFGNSAIYGMSGILDQLYPFHNRVCFRMHDTIHMQRMSENIPKKDLCPRTLFFLYLGYLPANEYLYYSEMRHVPDAGFGDTDTGIRPIITGDADSERSRTRVRTDKNVTVSWHYKLQQIEENQIPSYHLRLAKEMGIELYPQMIRKLSRVATPETGHWLRPDDRYVRVSSLSGAQESIMLRQTDKWSMVLALLRLNFSPQSFLCGKELLYFSRTILPSDLDGSILCRTENIIDRLQLPDDESQSLRQAVRKVKDNVDHLEGRGRTLMNSLHALDKVLQGLSIREKFSMPEMQAMGVLYLTSSYFRDDMWTETPVDARPELEFVIDPLLEVVRPPDRKGNPPPIVFDIDVDALFGVQKRESSAPPSGALSTSTLPCSRVLLACTHAYLKWYMWQAALTSKDLSVFYTRLEPIVYLSARDIPQETVEGRLEKISKACDRMAKMLEHTRISYPSSYLTYTDASTSGSSSGEDVADDVERPADPARRTKRSMASLRPRSVSDSCEVVVYEDEIHSDAVTDDKDNGSG